MLINDIPKDIKKICIDNDVSQAEISKKMGRSRQYMNYIIRRKAVNSNFVKFCELLGYDVVVSYVKR